MIRCSQILLPEPLTGEKLTLSWPACDPVRAPVHASGGLRSPPQRRLLRGLQQTFLPAFARAVWPVVGHVAGRSTRKFQLLLWKGFEQKAKQRRERGEEAQRMAGSGDAAVGRCCCCQGEGAEGTAGCHEQE